MGRKTQAAQRSVSYRVKAKLFSKEKETFLQKERKRIAALRSQETKEESNHRKHMAAEHISRLRKQMTEEEKKIYNQWYTQQKAQSRMSESHLERSTRIKNVTKLRKQKLDNESIEEKICRLEARRQENVFSWEAFDKERQNTNLEPCAICNKLIFAKGTATLIKSKINPMIVKELETTKNGKDAYELFEDKMKVCHRCNIAFTGKSPRIPSQVYWNNFYPGDVPEELAVLTPIEVRFISRLIPYLRIVKYKGRFGQYGLKGQAVLFPTDVTEVQEQILDELPRKSKDLGLMMVVEKLENIERQREFKINADHITKALNWLIGQNLCYKDLKPVDMSNFTPNYADFVVEAPEMPDNDLKNGKSAWKNICDTKANKTVIAQILHGQRHYNDASFGSHAGKQGLSMAVLSLVRHYIKPIESWDSIDIENVLDLGNHLHIDSLDDVMETSNPDNEINDVSIDFSNIKRCFNTYDKPFELVFTHTHHNSCNFSNDMKEFIQSNSYGIISQNDVYVTIIHNEDKYCFFDYRQRGPNGYASKIRGNAIVMRFTNIDKFITRLKSQLKCDNKGQFMVTSVLITFERESQNLVSTFGDNTPSLHTNPLYKSMRQVDQNSLDKNNSTGRSQEDQYCLNVQPNVVIYASRCQSDKMYAYTNQCTAMSAASIVRSVLVNPLNTWTEETLDEILDAGNELYKWTLKHKAKPNGSLFSADELRPTKRSIYGLNVRLQAEYFGGYYNTEISDYIERFFSQNTHGIFTCQGKSTAIMKFDNTYWKFDSHGFGTGKASLTKCSTIENLIKTLPFVDSNLEGMNTFEISVVQPIVDNNIPAEVETKVPYNERTPVKADKHRLPTLRRSPDIPKKFKTLKTEPINNSTPNGRKNDIDMVDLISVSSYSDSIDSMDQVFGMDALSDEELLNRYQLMEISPLKDENDETQSDILLEKRISLLKHVQKYFQIDETEIETENIHSKQIMNAPKVISTTLNLISLNDTHCACIAASAIFYDKILPFKEWDKFDVNHIQKEGDLVYKQIDKTSNVFTNKTVFYDITFLEILVSFQFKTPRDLNVSQRELVVLDTCLKEFFAIHPRGLIIFNKEYAFAIFKSNDLYCLYDPYCCDSTGKPAKLGTPCAIFTRNFNQFVKILQGRGSSKSKFTICKIQEFQTSDNLSDNESPIKENLSPPKKKQLPVDPTLFEMPIHVPESLMGPIDYTVPRPGELFEVDSAEKDINSDNIPLVQIKRATKPPVNEFLEKRHEELCFPTKFPYGTHGVNDNEERNPVPSKLEYIQRRIMGRDPRFHSRDYLLYGLSLVEKDKVQSAISMCGQIKQNGQNVQSLTSNLHLVMRTIRGSSAYWNNTLLDLLAMVSVLGPGTIFITLSCNDLNWEFMLKACLKAQGKHDVDPSKLTIDERQHLIEDNPVVVSRVFNKEVQNIVRLLKNGKALNGWKAKDYWYRIEFQQRGSPHLHMIVWIDNFPPLDSPEGLKAMDEICRCDIPEDDDELAELVKRHQTHRHTETCFKNNKIKTCRFGFPRPPCSKTRVLEIDTPEFLKNGHRVVEMKRTENCKFINNYNAEILMHWKGNMDFQFITSQAIIAYIAKYSCKCEPEWLTTLISDAINEAKQSNEQMGRRLFKVGMKILSQRQISCCESAYRLCHLPLRGSSRSVVFINTSRPEERYRMLKIDANGNIENAYFTNIIDRYMRRPDSMDNLSLAEFACLYQPHYYKKNNSIVTNEEDGDIEFGNNEENDLIENFDPENPTKQKLKIFKLKKNYPSETDAFIKERRVPAIFRSRYFSPNGNRVQYFYGLLLLHLPFRREEEILQKLSNDQNTNQNNRYTECACEMEQAFLAKQHLLKPLRQDCTFEEYRVSADEINRAILQIRALMDDDGDLIEDDDPQRNPEGFLATQEEEIVDMVQDVPPVPVIVNNNPKKLNADQNRVYRYVQKTIIADLEGRQPKQIKIFITGSAGTGKSLTIEKLVKLIIESYIDPKYRNKPIVKITAPTGVAAMLINGQTLHSALSLGIEHGKVSKHRALTGKYLEDQRKIWEFVKFLIIDEISMVSEELFRNICLRLQELKSNDLPFGGIHILTFGDLMQLKPVMGNPVYKQAEHNKHEVHLWKYFDFCELKQNMRQKDDLEFAELLNALRVGELHPSHMELLMNRVESEILKREGIFSDENATLIAPITRIVDEHNSKVLAKLTKQTTDNPNPPKLYTINAVDRLVENHKGVPKPDMSKIVPQDIKQCAGVPESIILALGARVMLRRNKSISRGLVNGSLGKVVGFTWRSFRKDQIDDGELPESVHVDFDGIGIEKIEPMSCTFNAKLGYGKIERLQVPLILAWAVTAHKLQGVTVECAVLDLGKEIFVAGQAYVMLSRVRNLNKVLILRSFSRNKLLRGCADSDALAEMLRLRSLPEIDWETLISEKEDSDLGKRLN